MSSAALISQFGTETWIILLLMAVIIVLLGVMLAGRGGYVKRRKLEAELGSLKARLGETEEAPVTGEEPELREPSGLFELTRDLETLRSAIAGSRLCQKTLLKKYKLPPGPGLLKRIMNRAKLPPEIKTRLADEIVVGEIGRAMLTSFNEGASMERAASDAGVPLVVAKGQVTRLQVLGYLDNRLKPTEAGWRAIG